MSMVVRAFPVLPGKEEEVREMAEALAASRKHDAAKFFRNYGIERESWYLQKTPHGTLVIDITDVGEPVHVQATAYAAAQGQFERWFKDRVRDLSGIDPDKEPMGPPTEQIYHWNG